MRDLLLRAQSWLHSLGHQAGPDDGTGHRPVYTPADAQLPAGLEFYGRLRTLAVHEPGGGRVTALDFTPSEVRLYLRSTGEPQKPGRKVLELIGEVGPAVLDLLEIDRERRRQPPVLLGAIERLRYEVDDPAGGPPLAYEHRLGYEFGSDGSELPILFYQPSDRRLVVLGGVYWVGLRHGIVN